MANRAAARKNDYRRKQTGAFPVNAANFCLPNADSNDQIDAIVHAFDYP